MIKSTNPSWRASSASSSRPPPATSETEPSGRPAASPASATICASLAFERVDRANLGGGVKRREAVRSALRAFAHLGHRLSADRHGEKVNGTPALPAAAPPRRLTPARSNRGGPLPRSHGAAAPAPPRT